MANITPKKNFKYQARIPWNKGKRLTKKHKENISKNRKGRPAWNKGLPMQEETRLLISKSKKGQRAWNKGIPRTEETKKKIAESRKGQPAWNKGLKWPGEIKRKISKTVDKQYKPYNFNKKTGKFTAQSTKDGLRSAIVRK